MKKIAAHPVNTATIWCLAKRMIAREWARARGIKRPDPRLIVLERQASCWKEKKEKEKKRMEEEKLRAQKQKELLKITLQSFKERLLIERENLEGALQEIGRIIQVNKSNGGWVAQIEPWEEMRIRNIQRRGKPPIIVYQVAAKAMGKKLKVSVKKLQDKALYPAAPTKHENL